MINSRFISGSRFGLRAAALFAILFLFVSQSSIAEPYLAIKTGNKCSACHINPIGGGARNDYGVVYGSQIMPRTALKAAAADFGKIADGIRVGGDMRANAQSTNQDTRGFQTQSAQLYFHLQPKDSLFSLYLDQQFAPGSSLNREALIMANFNDSHSVKMGSMRVPFGLYFEDDSAFVRESTQTNFDTRDTGVNYAFANANHQIDIAITNGTSANNNNDDKLQLTARAEHVSRYWRLGLSGLVNEFDGGDRVAGNIFAGLNLSDYILIAEFDIVQDSDDSTGDLDQNIWLLELNKEVIKGLNLKLTTEYHDRDTDSDNNERSRYSFIAEYTPVSYFQLRGGGRFSQDELQPEDDEDLNLLFAEAHFYF